MDTPGGSDTHGPPSVRRSEFYPVGSLDDKRNFKRLFRIERDGSIRETVHLDVPDISHREQLICLHYLRHLVRHFLRADTGIIMAGRDCPWDFRIELSTGEEFFLEVTSIADNPQHFEINKREERFKRWISEELIPVHELTKLADLFPTEELTRVVRTYSQEQRAKSELVPNPLRAAGSRIFVSRMPGAEHSLADEIRAAVEKKVNKKHAGKDATVLIVDNRTSLFDLVDYRSAASELAPLWSEVPFPEVWFYTGYYSDDDGNRAEFSFAPLKVTPEQAELLSAMDVDSEGVHVWS